MSTQRNSTSPLSRGRNIAAVLAAVIAPIAASIAACSVDAPTSPGPVAHGPAFSKGAPAPTPKPSAKDDKNRDTPDQIAAMAPTWHTTAADHEAGTDTPLNLACGISGAYTVSQPIGPNGGVLHFGASSLTIPKGALSSTVQISAKITLGQGRQCRIRATRTHVCEGRDNRRQLHGLHNAEHRDGAERVLHGHERWHHAVDAIGNEREPTYRHVADGSLLGLHGGLGSSVSW